MRDPMNWSLPIGNVFGISIRLHLLFPVVAVGLILRAASQTESPPHGWIDATGMMGLLFVAVLLHELGHCFAARSVEGDAHEILIWPLGGLAFCDVPHVARAHLITAAAGPLANLLLCVITGAMLAYLRIQAPFSPFWDWMQAPLLHLNGTDAEAAYGVVWLARFFYLNWVLFLLNVALVGYPLDAGRILQALLWPRMGYRGAMKVAIFAGFVTACVVAIYAIAKKDEVLAIALAFFIYISCQQQWILLEHGGDEALFGYDFSQGYTSLEKEPPARRQPGFWQRWQQQRAARRLQREIEERENEERRMDQLLEKVQREGLQSLTDEERRFMARVSARYRNRN